MTLVALTAEESAVYGAFLASADLLVHKPEQKIGKYAKSLSIKTLSDHYPEEAAIAASGIARVFSTEHINAPVSIVSSSSSIAKCPIIFIAESNQEIMESVVLAYRISEDQKIRLPAAVLYEYPKFIQTVQVPNITAINSFLPKRSLSKATGKVNVSVQDFTKHFNALVQKTEEIWKKKFHRSFGFIEGYKVEDATRLLIMSGFHFPTCKSAVDTLRAKGEKVGALRVRTLAPFPKETIAKHLAGKEISVLDNAAWGPLLANKISEMASEGRLSYNKSSFTYNKYLSQKDFLNIFSNIGKEGTFTL